LNWLESEGTYGPYVLSGISMGGQMAAFSGTSSQFDVGIVPFTAPYSAIPVFGEGLLSHSVDWTSLRNQIPLSFSDRNDVETARDFMREIYKITDLRHFPQPPVPEATIILSAKYDQYVTNAGEVIHEFWPGSELRTLETSHIMATFYAKDYLQAIMDSISRLQERNTQLKAKL